MNRFKPVWVNLLFYVLGLVTSGVVFYLIVESKLKNLQAPPQLSSVSYHTAPGAAPKYFEPTGEFQTAAQKGVPCVVYITTENEGVFNFFKREGSSSAGSGVIIAPEGYIVTNAHVVDEARKITVTLNDRTEYEAKLVAMDPNTDLAVLKIEAEQLPILKFADSDELKIGQWVIAVGNPFSLTSTVTAGIVSAKARGPELSRGRRTSRLAIESYIQTDAAVNPGNSGGALLTLGGDLVGINTLIASSSGISEGYSFAIPSNLVKKVATDLIQFGAVQRAFIGVSIGDINATAARTYNLEVKRGVLVQGLSDNGAARGAGLQTGDVITGIDGRGVANTSELQERIAERRPGDKVQLSVNRQGQALTLGIVLRNINGTTGVVTADAAQPREDGAEEADAGNDTPNDNGTGNSKAPAGKREKIVQQLGASFAAVSAQEKGTLGITGGVKIAKLEPGGALDKAGVTEGVVLTRVNKTSIATPDELLDALMGVQVHAQLEGYLPSGKRVRYLLTLR
jgi:Do/DeqQ family serine protease